MNKMIKIGCAMMITMLLLVAQPVIAAETTVNIAGKVVWVVGSFKAISSEKQERELKKDQAVYVGDTLVTSDRSQAQIVFSDQTLMTFRDNTKFRVEKYNYNPESKDDSVGSYVMELIEGGFRTVTGKIAKTNSKDYQVKTATATMGVRGTDYAAYVHDGKSFMMFYSGTPFMQNSKGIVILTRDSPYVYVPAINQAPEVMAKQPAIFKETLKIIPAVITSSGEVSVVPADVQKIAGGSGGVGGGAECEGPVEGFAFGPR